MQAATRTFVRFEKATQHSQTQTASWLLRFLLLFVGVALVVSAVGLWLVGVSPGDPAALLMKLGVSLCMLIIGLCCITMGRWG